jgi:hypothetical protein
MGSTQSGIVDTEQVGTIMILVREIVVETATKSCIYLKDYTEDLERREHLYTGCNKTP